MPQPFLSIVIPAYNESARIGSTIVSVCRHFQRKPYPTELIVVDDGSWDSSAQLLSEFAARHHLMRVLRNEPNRGKGFSVRRGALEARGELVLFTDADLSAPIEEADHLLAALESTGADAAVGSRALRRELVGIHQPLFREYGGRFFNLLMRLFTGLPIADTQCGFKLFRRATTRRAFELQQVPGFGFDPELLFLIQRLGGKIVEVPVRWNDNPATKVHFLRDSVRMVADLVAVRWRALTGKYPRS
ncbi:MAG: dolichyl-phosphate beta-glucosyltransferase [Terriglobia bacterium]